MQEIFENISEDIKRKADMIWRLALAQPNPIAAAKFLKEITEYYSNLWTEEEIEFLQFYFKMQMEMVKE